MLIHSLAILLRRGLLMFESLSQVQLVDPDGLTMHIYAVSLKSRKNGFVEELMNHKGFVTVNW